MTPGTTRKVCISVARFGEKELRALLTSRVLVGASYQSHIIHTSKYISRTRIYIRRSERLAARITGENSELQSAMSNHQYPSKRVSLGAQFASFSYPALATREHTPTVYILSYTLSSAQRQPPKQQQEEEEKEAAQQQQQQQQQQQAAAYRESERLNHFFRCRVL